MHACPTIQAGFLYNTPRLLIIQYCRNKELSCPGSKSCSAIDWVMTLNRPLISDKSRNNNSDCPTTVSTSKKKKTCLWDRTSHSTGWPTSRLLTQLLVLLPLSPKYWDYRCSVPLLDYWSFLFVFLFKEIHEGSVSWNWSYRRLWVTMWMMGLEPCKNSIPSL